MLRRETTRRDVSFLRVSEWDACLERKAQFRGAVEFASLGVPGSLPAGRCNTRLPCVRACVRVLAYVSTSVAPSPGLGWSRPQRGSDCGFEPGCHGVGAGGAVSCSPVGCDLVMGQHLLLLLLLLPVAPAVSTVHVNTHIRCALSKYSY